MTKWGHIELLDIDDGGTAPSDCKFGKAIDKHIILKTGDYIEDLACGEIWQAIWENICDQVRNPIRFLK